MSTHNIYFLGEIGTMFCGYPLLSGAMHLLTSVPDNAVCCNRYANTHNSLYKLIGHKLSLSLETCRSRSQVITW